MKFEMSIIPMEETVDASQMLVEGLKAIQDSGVPFQKSTSSTRLEGEWDQVMPLIKRVHEEVRRKTSHLVTVIKIEDEEKKDPSPKESLTATMKNPPPDPIRGD